MSNTKSLTMKNYLPASGKVFDKTEINNAISAARDCWWTEGRWAKQFEADFKKFMGVHYVSLVNSGSSANLTALAALTSEIFGEKRLKPGDEFITTPTAFPTTVNPGIIYGLKPVFIDSDTKTLNIDASQIKRAITKKTRLIMLAHTLGKPFDLDTIMKLVKKHDLWLIEDCCDALGSKYNKKLVGTFGHAATYSFYPAHQMTMGEGGAVITNHPLIHRSIRQFRDWGRDCWCDTGADNTCGKRFGWKLGDLPFGYDHKYTYSQIGYNLKLTDFQAAIGVAQLKKLPGFIKKRKDNYKILHKFFSGYPKYFQLLKVSEKEEPCWFGFPFLVTSQAPFSRNDLAQFLENQKIGTRNVFSGNLLRHPAYRNIKCRKIGKMINADKIMKRALWIGVWPGISKADIGYMTETIRKYLTKF